LFIERVVIILVFLKISLIKLAVGMLDDRAVSHPIHATIRENRGF